MKLFFMLVVYPLVLLASILSFFILLRNFSWPLFFLSVILWFFVGYMTGVFWKEEGDE